MWAWMDKARCKGVPTDIFYPVKADTDDLETIRSMCFRCPVQAHCAIAGLAEDEGFWAGYTPWNRKMWRRELLLTTVGKAGVPRFDSFAPLLSAIYAEEKHSGIYSAFISNMPDKQRAARWLKRVVAA